MDNCVSWDKEVSLHQLHLASSSQWEQPLLAEVWGIPLCGRNWAEIVGGKGKQMKRDPTFPTEH